MKFYMDYYLYKYEGPSRETFDTIDEVLEFLNKHASNPDFSFTVIEGRLVEFEPTELVKAYKRKGA